jgi:rod shape determining protein RodA
MLHIDRRLIKSFDWVTFSLVLALSFIGIITIYSATRPPLGVGSHPDFYLKQIVWLCIGVAALVLTVSFDYIWFQRLAYPLYVLGLILLVGVLVVGKTTMGAQRWVSIGPISFQPSEFFRIFFVIAFSSYLALAGSSAEKSVAIRGMLLFGVLPLALLVKQPDLGTAVLLTALHVVLLFAAGLRRKIIIITLVIGIISVPFLGNVMWEGLKDYQKNRIIAFMEPDVDPAGIGYHLTQSKISIGSGELLGKGYLSGTQGPLRFLPEKHTDFIFSVFSEEWGFAGCLLLLAVYLMLFLRGMDTAVRAKDQFGRLTAAGITAMFFVYFLVNVGMTIGIMPVVGVPLPFMSYGGTALLSNFIAAGILINIRTRRFELFYP